jgi:hypothetical protein
MPVGLSVRVALASLLAALDVRATVYHVTIPYLSANIGPKSDAGQGWIPMRAYLLMKDRAKLEYLSTVHLQQRGVKLW